MWKDSKRAKKRQKTEGQLGGKVTAKAAIGAAIKAAVATGEEAIKNKKGEIQDKEALDTLFNKIV